MDVYFSPMACSMATRIALYEAGADARFHKVDMKTRTTTDGADYYRINPKGMVPSLRTADGEILTENAAILTYVAESHPQSGLAPEGFDRYRLQQWLSFVASELHKHVYAQLLSPRSDEAAKTRAREAGFERLAYLNDELEGREYLLDRFTVADAYLVVVLNWSAFVGIDLEPFPNVVAYRERLNQRPSIVRARTEELALFQAA
jgi:glutathione S-transferase